MGLFIGIDVGSLTAEAAVVTGGRLLAFEQLNVLPHPVDSARAVVERLFEKNGIRPTDVEYAISTGYGRDRVQAAGLAQENVSEISCHAYGAFQLVPGARTVVDIGGQDAKAIKLNLQGTLDDFVMNDKCAAGTGHFLELMSRALGVTLEELGIIARAARRPVQVSSRCSVFIETEVHHFLQRGVPKSDIAAGVCQAMANRVSTLVRRVRPEPPLVMTGGVAKNPAVRQELEKLLGLRVAPLSLDPQVVGAYGAAMMASVRRSRS